MTNSVTTALISCHIQENVCSFLVPLPLTRSKLVEGIPFEGNFHFRVKVPGRQVGFVMDEFVWWDVVKEDIDVAFDSSANKAPYVSIEVQALLLDGLGEDDGDDESGDATDFEGYIYQAENILGDT